MRTLATARLTNLTMESLALPRELYWDGKMEPTSPPSSELFSITETVGNWLHEENFANEITLLTENVLELKNGLELPHDLINDEDFVVQLYDLQEEHWHDIKLQSPTELLENYPIGANVISPHHPHQLTKVENPFGIGATALGTSYDDSSILTQLTPPHSPPQNAVSTAAFQGDHFTSLVYGAVIPTATSVPISIAVNQAANAQHISYPTPWATGNNDSAVNSITSNNNDSNIAAPELNDDIARELQIVDEIVNTRARELLDWKDECDSLSSLPSQAGSTTDEEWAPASSSSNYCSSASSSPVRYNSGGEEQSSNDDVANTSSSQKKRTRPYGRGVEDRKIRKKEQNKNAATRYRQKKKLEMEHVLTEEQELTLRNEQLKRTLADRQREAKYLRTLIREFYQKKR